MKKAIWILVAFVGIAFVGGTLWSFNKAGLLRKQVQPRKTFRVLAYSSFLSSFGPAKKIETDFKAICNCDFKWVNGTSSSLLISRLKMIGSENIDFVIGLESLGLLEAAEKVQWESLEKFVTSEDWQEIPKAKLLLEKGIPYFLPFNWAPLSLVFRQGQIDSPVNLAVLESAKYKTSLALPDPRMSSLGLQWLNWIESSYPAESSRTPEGRDKILLALKSSIHSVSASWSSAYGIFQSGQAPLVLSFVTSPLYHAIHENSERYKNADLAKPPVHIEYFGLLKSSKSTELGYTFAKYLLRSDVQSLIAQKNYMFPAVKDVPLPEKFQTLLDQFQDPNRLNFKPFENGKQWLESWERVMQSSPR